MKNKKSQDGRRDFIKKMSLGGLSLAGLTLAPIEDQLSQATQNINRNSSPSDLEITDMRIAHVDDAAPIIRIYTNQGVMGHGDVRDGADPRYALMLKSRILGENPCNVERLFKIIKQFAFHGRQGGGVSGVEMALWDLAGKAYGVPVYQMLGGKYRDKIRVYADTPTVADPEKFAERMQGRIDQGYTALKMDVGIGLIADIPGTLVNAEFWENQPGGMRGWYPEHGSYGQTEHPFTRVQITEKGIEELVKYVAVMREKIGYEIPLGTDHWGHFGVNEAIKIARAVEPYTLAYVEDLIPWQYTNQWREITESTTTPTLTGEDIYGLEGFKPLIDSQAVNIVHPDPNSAGGILETKRIGDYAEQNGIAMMMHHAASPVSFLGSVHSAAATQNFMWLEHHSVDDPWWEDLVTGIDKPIVEDGYITVPNNPGIGVELNEEVVKEHLEDRAEFFAPTPEWDEMRSWDRLWS
ncbi:mandelate racemase/muconate lactonizing enzyme family protein [Aliifodinibius sp. S!AR15-10]|uniref:mandelate racemase/muconate lactonizing enzyme family protein n=1 Tax=Aliifodinibius sp. S!AR15-10 TaxID=2950437 RepID=UPI002857F6F8|nr:mandelate racemase/muconate lactonizing enzyme family protein [Aliifodinibius sp. S!AR15-10]MDR8394124.1 mandelate racemase/muconate lactonizing enzyme family protein [Aliifodinibius sp. S!AR15-10]